MKFLKPYDSCEYKGKNYDIQLVLNVILIP